MVGLAWLPVCLVVYKGRVSLQRCGGGCGGGVSCVGLVFMVCVFLSLFATTQHSCEEFLSNGNADVLR